MADITSVDILQAMKHDSKAAQHKERSTESLATNDLEKHPSALGYDMSYVPREDDQYVVTFKTWAVVMVLATSYGISFWPVPFFSTIQATMATSFGSPGQGTWLTSVYTASGTVSFMVCGANSDLFGRRYFILFGNILVFVGAVVGATSHSINQSIAAHVLIGFGAGCCQLAAFALPELLPNKWRHWAVVIADGLVIWTVIVGPVTARIAILHGEAWRWGYWGTAICIGISFFVLVAFYWPPAHPRGKSWDQAIRDLDYVGAILFTAAAAMILSGIVYVQLIPSNSPIVIGLLVAGFACLLAFGLWETFMPLKEPLTPTRMFTANKGRTLSVPFVIGFAVSMFYYGNNITWPTMVNVYFKTATTPLHVQLLMSTVQGLGILAGAIILSFAGTRIGHWKLQQTIPLFIMTFFGGLFAYINPDRENMAIAFAFLSSMAYGYAQYLSIAYIQFGAEQTELGIAGGLAGVARYAGGAVAVAIYETILSTVQASYAKRGVIAAAEMAGASPSVAQAVLAALPLGATALEKVQGLTTTIATAAKTAFVESYHQGVKTVALTSIGFGGLAVILSLFLEDIGPKMTPKIEIFLENDTQAEKNKFH